MKRSELEHLIRAASAITQEDEFIIIGTGAILGKAPDAPRSLRQSEEADMYPKRTPALAELIDGTIGELSPFHTLNKYYAHGVGPETAVLPKDWKNRLIKVQNENTNHAIGWCIDPHDLAFSKLAAGRPKDTAFVKEMLRYKIIKQTILDRLIDSAPEDLREKLKPRFQRIKNANVASTHSSLKKGSSNGPGGGNRRPRLA